MNEEGKGHPRPSLVLRPAIGVACGSGHVSRCFSLAQAWTQSGGEATILAEALPNHWRSRCTTSNVAVSQEWPRGGCDWAVVDGYGLGRLVEDECRGRARYVLAIDDFGLSGAHSADVILDQNLGAQAEVYASSWGEPKLLLGPRYALLRSEFQGGGRGREIPEHARRVLVSLGEAANVEVRNVITACLEAPELAGVNHSFLDGVENVAAEMQEADLAISAAGTTTWELLASGVPSIFFALAPNQVEVARRIGSAKLGLVIDLFSMKLPTLLSVVYTCCQDRQLRTRLSRRGSAMVDGRGARRTNAVLRSYLVRCRIATATDKERVFIWSNDPEARSASRRSDPISWASHDAWFDRFCADPSGALFIAETVHGEPIGQVRFEDKETFVEISVSVGASFRGQGWGAPTIVAGMKAFGARRRLGEVRAHIKRGNVRSQSAFRDSGFEYVGVAEGEDGVLVYGYWRGTGQSAAESSFL